MPLPIIYKKGKAIIVDIDGTLSERNPLERDIYDHAKAHTDFPVQAIIDLLHSIRRGNPEVDMILVTGRFAEHNEVTANWLQKHGVPFNLLYMRENGDKRPDNVIKKEIYHNVIEPYYDVWFVLDDRNKVVDMWRKELGLVCLQVNYGDF